VVVLQEAPIEASTEASTDASPGRSLAAYLADETSYPHVLHLAYDGPVDDGDRPEGLMVLSQLAWRDHWISWGQGAATHNNWGAKVMIEAAGARLGITNVHLDWEHPDARLAGIAAITRDLIDRHPADIEILCGDFNDYEDGPVAALLEGEAGFAGAGDGVARTPWCDAVASVVGRAAAPVTLDFAGNPRWKDAPVDERPGRFDRIYVRGSGGRPPPRILASGLFGKQPANRFGIVPSDHYGVFVDLEL
jgi:endonuclease/exonuclease/phosphatase family metal-dependent hydrolase